MTAHELAKKLLEMPNVEVRYSTPEDWFVVESAYLVKKDQNCDAVEFVEIL